MAIFYYLSQLNCFVNNNQNHHIAMKMRNLWIVAVLLAVLMPQAMSAREETVYSPSRNIVVNFDVKDGIPYYNVLFNGKQVIKDSRLGLELVSAKSNGDFNNFDNKQAVDQNSLYDGFAKMTARYQSFDETWSPVWGEESSIRNHYNEMAVTLHQNDFGRYIVVRFRVYDDGVGFRYEFPQQDNLTYFVIKEERTQFAMPGDITAWWIAGDYDTQEYQYTRSRLSEIRGSSVTRLRPMPPRNSSVRPVCRRHSSSRPTMASISICTRRHWWTTPACT